MPRLWQPTHEWPKYERDIKKTKASTVGPPEDQDLAVTRHYAVNGDLANIDALPRERADPNATGPGDDPTSLFCAAWGGGARTCH